MSPEGALRVETDIRQAAASIGAHEVRLGQGDIKIDGLEERGIKGFIAGLALGLLAAGITVAATR